MADEPANDTPPRRLSPGPLGVKLLGLDLSRSLRSRKTAMLFAIQLLPALVAAVALAMGALDGFSTFEDTVATVHLPFLIPLAALFLGGPTIVDEVEAETITYLTLRPLSRTALLAAKLASSMIVAVAVTLIPVLIFFGVCALDAGQLSGALGTVAPAAAAVVVGTISYTAIFALLGVVFASTLLPGIVYYVVFELFIAAIPIIEFASVKFHLFTLAGLERAGGEWRDDLQRLLLDQPFDFDWWVGLLACGLITGAAVLGAALVFRNREFHI